MPHLFSLADPQWTNWSPWSDCSLTCGLGLRRKERACVDAITDSPMQVDRVTRMGDLSFKQKFQD